MNKSRKIKHRNALGALGLLLASTSGSAYAALITISITGMVTEVDAILGGTFAVNDILTGTYTYETTTVDANGGATVGSYGAAITASGFSIGAYDFTGGTGILIANDEDLGAGIQDTYSLFPDGGVGAVVNGKAFEGFGFQLGDTDAAKLANDNLPNAGITLAGFEGKPFSLTFADGNQVIGVLTAHTPVPAVPLPGAFWLFGSGLLGLIGGGLSRRNKSA